MSSAETFASTPLVSGSVLAGLSMPQHLGAGQAVAPAVRMGLLARLRKALRDRAQKRALIRDALRLAETSPHLLNDIGYFDLQADEIDAPAPSVSATPVAFAPMRRTAAPAERAATSPLTAPTRQTARKAAATAK